VARTKKKGLIRRITESSAARTKFPAFSPSGTNIATWTEVNGEEQLLLHAADAATGETLTADRGEWEITRLSERLATWPLDRFRHSFENTRNALRPGFDPQRRRWHFAA